MKAIAQVNFEKYLPLDVKLELKDSTEKKLYTYWSETCQRLDLVYKFGVDGYLENVDQESLGPDFIVENVQWSGNIPDEYNVKTLRELMESREFESELFQFQINSVKVDNLLADKHIGFLEYNRLVTPIDIVYLPNSNQFIIGGGRHRLVALATMFKCIRGYENFNVHVRESYAKSMDEVARFVEMNNMSRTMTRTETSMLHAAAKGGLTIFAEPEEFFAEARKITRTSDLKDLSRRLWTALLQDTLVGKNDDVTANTLGDIGNGFITKLCRALNHKYGSGCDKVLLLTKELPDGRQEQVFELVTRDIVKILVANWSAYLNEIKIEIKDRRTGEQKVDSDGNLMWSISPSRHYNQLAQMLCDVMMDQIGDELGKLYEGKKAEDARKKQQRKEDNKVKALRQSIATLEGSVAQFKQLEMAIPAGFLEEIASKRQQLEQEIRKAQTNAPAQPEKSEALEDLLT